MLSLECAGKRISWAVEAGCNQVNQQERPTLRVTQKQLDTQIVFKFKPYKKHLRKLRHIDRFLFKETFIRLYRKYISMELILISMENDSDESAKPVVPLWVSHVCHSQESYLIILYSESLS